MNWLYGEPTLGDMLADPIIIAVMKRDHVNPYDLVLLLEAARSRLKPEAFAPESHIRASPTPVRDRVTA
jgi:hypothetical protein